MKTDKELLILAAKAAGYETYSWSDKIVRTDRRDSIWNPLSDDGDALRLAVDLGLYVQICDLFNATVIEIKRITICEKHNTDKHAATRRAIVRAAAAIGEAM